MVISHVLAYFSTTFSWRFPHGIFPTPTHWGPEPSSDWESACTECSRGESLLKNRISIGSHWITTLHESIIVHLYYNFIEMSPFNILELDMHRLFLRYCATYTSTTWWFAKKTDNRTILHSVPVFLPHWHSADQLCSPFQLFLVAHPWWSDTSWSIGW